MLSKFLDPKNDVAFRRIFGNKKNKDILIHFLNDVLVFRGKSPIKEITFLKTIQDPEIASKKTSIVDILCEDDEGDNYIVEMQVARTTGFEKRALYYASKAYSSQANIGEKYYDLKEVIFLAIADYIMFPNKKEYKSDHVILDKETFEHDLQDFSFTFIELPKFTKTLEELTSLQDKWCYFFKHAEDTSPEDLKILIGKDEIIERVYHELNRFYWTEQEILAYEHSEKEKNDYLSSLEQKFVEGVSQGMSQGIAQGMAQGIAQGIAEERAKSELEKRELQAKAEKDKATAIKEFARNLYKQGIAVSSIQLATNLSKEEIESL